MFCACTHNNSVSQYVIFYKFLSAFAIDKNAAHLIGHCCARIALHLERARNMHRVLFFFIHFRCLEPHGIAMLSADRTRDQKHCKEAQKSRHFRALEHASMEPTASLLCLDSRHLLKQSRLAY